jgi:hypothetical protein
LRPICGNYLDCGKAAPFNRAAVIIAQVTMKKALKTLFLIACLMAAGALPARAIVIVNATEIGGNVVFAGGGTLNLADLAGPSSTGSNAGIFPSSEIALLGANPSTSVPVDFYSGGVVSPGPFGPGGGTIGDLGSGDRFGVFQTSLVVPAGYSSGGLLNGSITFTGATFASLGVTPGTYIWSWSEEETADSFILNIGGTSAVPESGSTAVLMLLALGALALLGRFGQRLLPALGRH